MVLLASFLLLSSAFSINHNKAHETKADMFAPYIAIDASKGIGYLSSHEYDFMRSTSYFCNVDLDNPRESTIFLQDALQGSDSFLSDIVTVKILDKVSVKDCSFFFNGLENLETIENIANLDLSQCSNFEYMFAECPKLKSVDFTGLDVSKCPCMRNMFIDCALDEIDLSGFDTSSCGDFRGMFSSCDNITSLDLSSFDTHLASHMEEMFSGCPELNYLDISSFDLSNSPLTDGFFRGTDPDVIVAPKVIPTHNNDNVVKFHLQHMSMETPYYYDCDLNTYDSMIEANESITYYHFRVTDDVVSTADNFNRVFANYEDLKNIDVDTITSIWDSFDEIMRVTYPAEDYEPFYTIFEKCTTDTINETTGKCLKTYEEVYNTYCHVLQDCGGDIFNRCPTALNPDSLIHIGVNTTDNIGYLSSVDTYEILKSDLKTKVDLRGKTIGNSIFSFLDSNEYENITSVVIQDEIKVLNCANFFKGLSNIISIEGMQKFNSEGNTDCTSMFEGCSKLETIDLSAFNTGSVLITDSMFENCSSLAAISGLSFTSKSLISTAEMFSGCENITLIDLSKYDLTNVTNTFNFFHNSTPFYIKTPKAMPTNSNCDLVLYSPMGINDYKYYDSSFNVYEKLPKNVPSFTIISTLGKYVLDDFCDDFGKDTAYYCDANGNTSEEKLIKLWEGQSGRFNKKFKNTPSECLLEFFEQDNSLSKDNSLKAFSEKYDYIYGKYQSLLDEHGGDFANRTDLISFASNSSIIRFNEEYKDSSIIVIIIVSVSGVAALSLLIIKKHKLT